MLMFDNETYLMITIFQTIHQLNGLEESDPAKYLKLYESEIKDAGLVLEYLGLAKLDKKSPLGWRPTPLLLGIIARRLSKQKRQREDADDELTGHLLSDAVFGEQVEGQRGHVAYLLLLELGLLQENDAGGWGATKELQKLFSDGYYRRYLHKSIERHRHAA
jgi:hypothetical protein